MRQLLFCLNARGHHGSPASALKIQQIYGTSVLLSGLAALVLSQKEVSLLENHYKTVIERIQKLHSNTPRAFVYLLAGTLPLEGILHSRQLTLFSMICRLKMDPLYKHAYYMLTTANSSSRSWFFQIRACRKQCSRDCARSAARVQPSTLLCMILQ